MGDSGDGACPAGDRGAAANSGAAGDQVPAGPPSRLFLPGLTRLALRLSLRIPGSGGGGRRRWMAGRRRGIAVVATAVVVATVAGAGFAVRSLVDTLTDPARALPPVTTDRPATDPVDDPIAAPADGRGGTPTGTPTGSPTGSPAAEPTADRPAGPDRAGGPGAEPAGRVGPETGGELVPLEWTVPRAGPGAGRMSLPATGAGPFGALRATGLEAVALTFDDGPDPRWTPQVLDLLRTYRVRATFCVVGELARAHPDLLREIVAAGHTLCNHSWDHDLRLGERPREEIRENLRRTNAAIWRAVPSARVSYYRQPGGFWTRQVVEVAAELGMSSLHWQVDPRDWREPGDAVARTVATATGPGAIVLLHDGGGDRSGTVAALRRILPEMADRLVMTALPPEIDPPRRHGLELPARPAQR